LAFRVAGFLANPVNSADRAVLAAISPRVWPAVTWVDELDGADRTVVVPAGVAAAAAVPAAVASRIEAEEEAAALLAVQVVAVAAVAAAVDPMDAVAVGDSRMRPLSGIVPGVPATRSGFRRSSPRAMQHSMRGRSL